MAFDQKERFMDARTMVRRNAGAGGGGRRGPDSMYRDLGNTLNKKWDWLTEGIPSGHRRDVMSIILENQMRYLKGRVPDNRRNLFEEVRSGQVGQFLKFVFPLIRRSFAQLITPDIVSVQPMTAPIGGIFFFHLRHGTTKGRIVAGDEIPTVFDESYSSERIRGELLGAGDGVNTVFNHQVRQAPVRNATLSVFVNNVEVGTANVANIIAGVFGGGAVAGTIQPDSGVVTLNFAIPPALTDEIRFNYTTNYELNSDIPQVNLDVEVIPVEAQSRKLKIVWSAEAAEDLIALQGFNMDAELSSGISTQMALDVDREVLSDLLTAGEAGISRRTFNRVGPSGVSDIEHLRSIIVPISQVSQLIHKATIRGAANWIVTSPEVVALLDAIPEFAPVGPEETMYSGGVEKVGMLQRRWTVYKDPYFKANKMLLGFQGSGVMETGYVFAPYIPITITDPFEDPADFSIRKGLRTRYAKRLVRPEFYGVVTIENL